MHQELEEERANVSYLDHISEIKNHENHEKVLVIIRLEENAQSFEDVEIRKKITCGIFYPVLNNLCTSEIAV